MYWSRTGSYLDLLAWLLLCGLWWAGGWLLSAHTFRLRARERLFTGMAIGLLCFIVFSDLLALILPLSGPMALPAVYWVAATLIFTLGLLAAWHSTLRPRFPWKDLLNGPQILAFTALFCLMMLTNRGMALFDDFVNLPLVSRMATGDVPPHFHLNPGQLLAYHYGLHLFSASLVRIGGFFPWSALDLGKALTIALSMQLAWLWLRRYVRSSVALFFSCLLIFFAAGARWLLLLVPPAILQDISARLNLLGSAYQTDPNLYLALVKPWNLQGSGPIPFPFAFVNGLFHPLSFAMRGTGAILHMTLLLLLLLAPRRWRAPQGLACSVLLASLLLTGEHLFVMVWAGFALAAIIAAISQRSLRPALEWGWCLVPAAVLTPLLGGVLSPIARGWLAPVLGMPAETFAALPGISLRWPPALPSAHLGALSLSDPGQILIALAESGPVLWFAPWIIWLVLSRPRRGRPILLALNFAAMLGFTSALFIDFSLRDRDLYRLVDSALFIWLITGFPLLWIALKRARRKHVAYLSGAAYAIAILSGLALFIPQLVAIARPQPSFFVQQPDAIMSKRYWNRLEEDAWILDQAYPYRSPTLFGRTTGPAYQDAYIRLPEFRTLVANPTPREVANAGYSYVYFDRKTWQSLAEQVRRDYRRPCAVEVFEQRTATGDFRRLYDVRACKEIP